MDHPAGDDFVLTIERELAGWELWMAVGRLAMARHQQRHPHALLSFSQLTRLLQIAFDFGRLARTPLESNVPVQSGANESSRLLGRWTDDSS
jgi:hypothetical protein